MMHRNLDDGLGLYLKCGGYLISLEDGDDVALEVLNDRADFGMDWTVRDQ